MAAVRIESIQLRQLVRGTGWHTLTIAFTRCNILTLEIPEPGVELNVLGLVVDTSAICLDIYAVEGEDSLLGNLLCGLTNLLSGPGLALGEIQALVDEILAVLDELPSLLP